jgi:hypothetical protein
MKRDMDLVRKILFEMENAPHGYYEGRMAFEGYTSDQIGYHVMLMMQAGLIEGCDVTTHDSFGPEAIPTNMTWAGYDFLDASCDDNRWNKAKDIVKEMGSSVTFDVLKSLLVQIMMSQIPRLVAYGA